MRIEKLKCLLDIAQTGSISATAQRLYISQQAVSKNIKHLEQELGVEVLVRTKTGVFFNRSRTLGGGFCEKSCCRRSGVAATIGVVEAGGRKERYIY